MKKIKIQSLLAAAALIGPAPVILTSCEDTLDMPSYTADSVDFVFGDEKKAEIYVKGCYRGLIHEEQYRQYNTGDGVTHAAEDAYSGSKFYISNFFFDPKQGPYTLGTTFSEGYRLIEACNLGLDRIAKLPSTAKTKALMGELYTIRGLVYHNLIRFYGDVPAKWTPDLDKELDSSVLYPSRTSRDVIYDHIIADIADHVDDIPWQSESGYGFPERISKQGALAILARICLLAGGYSLRWHLDTYAESSLQLAKRPDEGRIREIYEIADTALNRIITQNENDLIQAGNGMSGFQNLFYNYCQRNYGATAQEMIFQTACLGATTNSSFGVYNGQPGSFGGQYGDRKTLQFNLPTYYLSFDPADTRRDVTCCDYSVYPYGTKEAGPWCNSGTTYSSILSGKFRIQWCTAPQEASKRNIDVPVIRFADVLLMYAETQNYLFNGPTGEAIAALKRVRDRAGVGHLPIPSGKDDFQKAIMQERQWELADEMTLRTDLIRMDLLDWQVHKTQDELVALSDHSGAYANVPTIRLYKVELDEQVYGTKFLTTPYIEVTDPAELATIAEVPAGETLMQGSSARKKHQKAVEAIVAAHGGEGTYYAVRMFESYNSDYNANSRWAAGFNMASIRQINVGSSHYTLNTGRAENGGEYPRWIDPAKDRVYYAYKRNKVELLPLADISVGHPLVDNPNLKQLPGY